MSRLKIYTDGSYTIKKNIGGWGAVCLIPPTELHLFGIEKNRSNNQLEMIAVIEAVKEMLERNIRGPFEIYSDSKYVINCAQNIWTRKANLELWKEFDKTMRGLDISYVWVKAHVGDKYNEIADKLSREYIN
jgi:ribonuclease HI